MATLQPGQARIIYTRRSRKRKKRKNRRYRLETHGTKSSLVDLQFFGLADTVRTDRSASSSLQNAGAGEG